MHYLYHNVISSKRGKLKGNGWSSETFMYHGLNFRKNILEVCKMTLVVPSVERDNELIATSENILIKDSSHTLTKALPGDRSCPWLTHVKRAFRDLKEIKFASVERINISSHSCLKAFAPTLCNYISFHQKILLDSLFFPQFQNYNMSACSWMDMYIWHKVNYLIKKQVMSLWIMLLLCTELTHTFHCDNTWFIHV